MFVFTTAPVAAPSFGIVGGPVVQLPEWTGIGVQPPAVDVLPSMVAYLANIWILNPGNLSVDYTEVLQYLLQFADLEDWKAAYLLATSMAGNYRFPVFGLSATAAGSVTIVAQNTAAGLQPTVNAQIPIRDFNTLVNQNPLRAIWQVLPAWNCFGMPSGVSVIPGLPLAGAAAPRPITAINAFIQDTPWLTKLAIVMKMYKKTTLVGTDLMKLTKCRFKNLYFAHRELSQVMIQMWHNKFQSMGVTYRELFTSAAGVADRRIKIYEKIYDDFRLWQIGLVGYQFVRPQLPISTEFPVNPPGNILQGFYDQDAYYDTPIYLFDHGVFLKEQVTYYPVPEVNITLRDVLPPDVMEPGASGVQNVFALATGGANAIRSDFAKTFTGKSFDGMVMNQNIRAAYALSKTISFLNPTPINSLIDVYVIGKTANLPDFIRPIYNTNLLQWLRWSSAASPSDIFRSGARGWLFWSLPFYPTEYSRATGQQYLLGMNTQTSLMGPKLSYNMQGLGSANYGLIRTQLGVDSRLTITQSPF